MAHLELDRLAKRYAGSTGAAVQDLSLDVADGELLCLLGPSGCGKTTTLRMVGGFIIPDSGDVRIDGVSIARQPPERRPTAMVFQRYALWPHMDVWHNIAFGLQLRHAPRRETDARVQAVLDLVGLSGLARRYPAQLSGGQQQRVALARALVLEPRILLLDEPLSNLDAQLRYRMRDELRSIQRRVGITTVFVTHDQEEALSLADRIAVMRDGVLQQLAAPADLYARPATLFVATFIGTMNLLEGRVEANGKVAAGPFRLALPDGVSLAEGTAVTAGIRPEDLLLEEGGDVPVRVTQAIDLGHYRRVTLQLGDGAELVAFAGKSQELPAAGCTLRAPRVLFYANEQLLGAAEPAPTVPITA
ncbi:MAG: ABC transporter ATP-binding protein [Chloroflexota bacterium]